MKLPDCSLELLSPCRNADIGIQAISHGADAVYIGGPSFSARANAGNSMMEIERLVKYAHTYRARIYLALNTIMTDKEIKEATKIANQAWDAGVDALIIQDMGLLMCDLPPIQLHASTQCDIRTVAKAKFLESVGFSQLVLARELDLAQIKEIYSALTTARIEHFVHGALCVSYSGQCYASQMLKGRSANRGECAQICRLPFDVSDSQGDMLLRNSHVLSLRDNNQSANLASLIEAGVRSFKIEGRYKDANYVKNVTAYYRKLLDAYLTEHPNFTKSSQGSVELTFEPDINKSFSRGSTDYFTHGRKDKMANFRTPKSVGETVGEVVKIEGNSLIVKSSKDFSNGDGLTYIDGSGQLQGFLVNKAEKSPNGNQWIFHLREAIERNTDLKRGLKLMRNKDASWLKVLAGTTSNRKIPINIDAKVSKGSITLVATDPEGNQASVVQTGDFPLAKSPEKSLESLRKSLGKLGETEFRSDLINIQKDEVKFFPASYINNLRRQLTEDLSQRRQLAFQKLELGPKSSEAPYPENNLDFHANVLNQKAKEFYEKHGAKIAEMALEAQRPNKPIEVMRCKYCIRREIGECPKEGVKEGRKISPTPLKLKSGNISLEARFDCKRCEMSIIANPYK